MCFGLRRRLLRGHRRHAHRIGRTGFRRTRHHDLHHPPLGYRPLRRSPRHRQIRGCFDDPETQIATLVKPFTPEENIFNENSPKVVLSASGDALCFSRSVIPFLRGVPREEWQARHTYYKHIGLYAYRSEVLRTITRLPASPLEKAESLEQLRWLENGYRIRTAVTTLESHAIDTPEDLQRILRLFPAEG